MRIPLIATCLVAGSGWSFAFTGPTASHNPKTSQRPAASQPTQVQPTLASKAGSNVPTAGEAAGRTEAARVAAKLQQILQRQQAAAGQNPQSMSQGGMTQGTFQGLPVQLGLNGSDNCSTPDVLTGTGVWAFDTTTATTGTDGQNEALCTIYGQSTIDSDVWYSWTAPTTGLAKMNFCGGTNANTKVAAYAGSGCPVAGTAIACDDDYCYPTSQINFLCTAGSTYTLQVGASPGYAGGFGAFQLQVLIPAVNDDCSTATAISGTGTFAFDTTGASTGSQQGLGCGQGTAFNDVWYDWTCPTTGVAIWDFCSQGGYDTLVAAYAGQGCPTPGSAIGCNDDAGCGFQNESQLLFACTAGSHYMLQVGGFLNSGVGVGNFSLTVAQPPANDDCTTPTVISGTGTFSFDNLLASTGIDGQNEALCAAQYGQFDMQHDVWYSWTAPSTGRASLSTCNQTSVDTKIGVYAGSGCPAVGTAIACNDDACNFQSSMCFDVTGGQTYMIQVATFPGASGGVGQFGINVGPANPLCTLDDSTTENLLTWFNGGDIVWLNTFGSIGSTSVVSSVSALWGSVLFPGYNPGNGTPTDLFVWQDGVSQDGDPSDATLLLTVPTTVSLVDTDTYVNFPIAPLSITGVFFVGCHQDNYGLSGAGPTQYVAPMDTDCPHTNVAWFFGNNSGFGTSPVDYTNPSNNVQPPFTFDSIGLPCQVCVRAGCNVGPASYLCDPGSAGTIACPCANPPSGSGRGCDNSSSTGGASINGAGSNSLGSPTLAFTTAGEKPTATSILLQGASTNPTGFVFGQGVRCVAGTLKRLYVKAASGGSITAPNFGLGDLDIPTRSSALGDPISAGQTRAYMVYYRDPVVLGGCSSFSTFNATNTASVNWQP